MKGRAIGAAVSVAASLAIAGCGGGSPKVEATPAAVQAMTMHQAVLLCLDMAYLSYKQVVAAAESFGATAKEAPGAVRFVVQRGCPKYAKKLPR